jgi:PucR C-terminal helix-turn-helix domain/GGDEF-like domain
VRAAEATLGYRLRQYHVGLVCWVGGAVGAKDEITRLEQAIGHVAGKAGCPGDPVFLPRDESSAWAWLPLGIRDTFDSAAAAGVDADVRFAFGDAAKGAAGFRLTHRQALGTLAGLADDDEHQARLRETLLIFLQTGGSYMTTAEQLMLHKNTVQYRIRKAKESLGRPVGENLYEVELALQASRWLGSSVLRPAAGHDHDPGSVHADTSHVAREAV